MFSYCTIAVTLLSHVTMVTLGFYLQRVTPLQKDVKGHFGEIHPSCMLDVYSDTETEEEMTDSGNAVLQGA